MESECQAIRETRPRSIPTSCPQDVRMIGDIESLRAISDPTRLRILETMVQRQDPAWSVKELAAEIGVPPTRLYHHVEQLLERDLIRPVERRIVSGIIETRYRVVAKSFQLDRRLLAGDSEAQRQVLHDTLVTVFDTARNEIEESIRSGVIDTAERRPGRAARRPVARHRPALPRPGRRAPRAHQGARGRVRRGARARRGCVRRRVRGLPDAEARRSRRRRRRGPRVTRTQQRRSER